MSSTQNLTSAICLHTVCFIWPIDRTLSGATTPGQSEPGSYFDEGYSVYPNTLALLESHN